MGYNIRYGQSMTKEFVDESKWRGVHTRFTVLIAVIALIIAVALSDGGAALRKWILPGDPTVTEQAVQTFMDELSDGAGFRDAVAAFCEGVLNGAASK